MRGRCQCSSKTPWIPSICVKRDGADLIVHCPTEEEVHQCLQVVRRDDEVFKGCRRGRIIPNCSSCFTCHSC